MKIRSVGTKKKWYLKYPFSIWILFILAITYCSCNNSDKRNLVGKSDKWEIYKLNDTIFVCLPYLNADDKLNPVVINLKKPNKQ